MIYLRSRDAVLTWRSRDAWMQHYGLHPHTCTYTLSSLMTTLGDFINSKTGKVNINKQHLLPRLGGTTFTAAIAWPCECVPAPAGDLRRTRTSHIRPPGEPRDNLQHSSSPAQLPYCNLLLTSTCRVTSRASVPHPLWKSGHCVLSQSCRREIRTENR